jgi:hypothetical protein
LSGDTVDPSTELGRQGGCRHIGSEGDFNHQISTELRKIRQNGVLMAEICVDVREIRKRSTYSRLDTRNLRVTLIPWPNQRE